MSFIELLFSASLLAFLAARSGQRGIALAADRRFIHLQMPDVRPDHDETYLCVAQRLNQTEHEFIVGFEPRASATKVHHIIIYGCKRPGKYQRDTPKHVWECGEMSSETSSSQARSYDKGEPCEVGTKSTILFAWALDAPAIDLQPHVGFKVGGQSDISYLVLQVHYGHTHIFRRNPSITDDSGIILHTVFGEDHGITRLAGIYILLSYGYVTKGLSRHSMECTMNEDKVIHPFRFRTHTHKLGTNVAGFKRPADNLHELQLIGQHDPQKPQMFYPIDKPSMTITKGDRIYAYCDYNNTRDHEVMIGSTGNDEMCNFYIMYWTDGDELPKNQDCITYNPH